MSYHFLSLQVSQLKLCFEETTRFQHLQRKDNMKGILKVFLGVIMLQICVVLGDDVCRNDNDCKRNECCAQSRWGIDKKSCKDKGDEVGERCGGDYLCSCEAGLVCKPDEHTFWNKFRFGTGTCQRNNPPRWNVRYGIA